MSRAKELLRFAVISWRYLGCDSGTGRWRARWTYLAGILPAAVRFDRLMRGEAGASGQG